MKNANITSPTTIKPIFNTGTFSNTKRYYHSKPKSFIQKELHFIALLEGSEKPENQKKE